MGILTKEIQPYEFLARWRDGALSGSHVQFIEVLKDDGVTIQEKVGDAMPVGAKGFPLADVLEVIHADALTALAAAQAETATKVAEANAIKDAEIKAANDAAAAAVKAANDERAAIIAKYQAVIDALQNPEKSKADAQLELEKEHRAREREEWVKKKMEAEAKIDELDTPRDAVTSAEIAK